LRALEALGFSTLSADGGGGAVENSKVNFLPMSCELRQLRNAVERLKTSSDNQPIIVVLFHQYDFKEIDENRGFITLQEFSNLLNWLKSQENIRLLSMMQANKVVMDLSADRFIKNKRYNSIETLLPLAEQGSVTLYQESPALIRILLEVAIFYLMILVLSTFLSFKVGVLFFPRFHTIMKIFTLISILLSIIILVHALYDLKVYFRSYAISTCILGVTIGLCLSFQYIRKKTTWDNNSMRGKIVSN
jgi:hypothetical protein